MSPRLVREVMRDVPQLEAGGTVGDALAASRESAAELALVTRDPDELPAIVRLDALEGTPPGRAVADLVSWTPPPVLREDEMFDAALERLAKTFVVDRSLAGALVDRGDEGWAVVPRSVFVQYAGLVTTRGGGGRLEGAPVDLLEFECPVDHERKVVAYYDPSAPPRCSQGHEMEPVD